MMSSENIPPPEIHPSSNRKEAAQRAAGGQDQQLKCPRCDSSNTKFCYYNNYSLSQPRYFCKTCRRYWTKGGALRNVPIGGGCRKSKKLKTSSSSLSSATPSATSADFGVGFKFPATAGTPTPMEFQLGGLSLPRLHPATAGVYTQFIASSSGPGPGYGLDLLGLNYPLSSTTSSTSSIVQGQASGGGDHPISITSIESLSSMNQEMHWKLQQQRMAMMYGGGNNNTNNDNINVDDDKEKPQGVMDLFQSFEINSNNKNNNDISNTVSEFNGVHVSAATTWSDFHQFNELQ